MDFSPTGQPRSSPWGSIQHAQQIAPGIWSVSTAGHGGIKLSAARNRAMPADMRLHGGWYEEDCDAALVGLVFPEAFPNVHVDLIKASVRNHYPEAYKAFTGEPVTAENSRKLRDREFEERTCTSFVVRSAWGSWAAFVPDGMVGVYARRASDGAERWYFVPAEEYRTNKGPFVVDELRHAEIKEPAYADR